jgi:uncharacterized protein (DUF362 family)
MIYNASKFVFTPPPRLSWARRVLIKPSAGYPLPYPVTTSPELLHNIIEGIRKVSDADIIIADGTPDGSSIYPVYQALGYHFRRVLLLDVKDSIFVEMENPLLKFYATPTFWVPNLAIRSDFLISVTPFKVCGGSGRFSIANLLGLLPVDRYRKGVQGNWAGLQELGMENVFADLYYTLPFDLGIIEARQKFTCGDDPSSGVVEPLGKMLIGEPYEVDREASQLARIQTEHLRLIDEARNQLEE